MAVLKGEPPNSVHTQRQADLLMAAASEHGILVALYRSTAHDQLADPLWSSLGPASRQRRAHALRISLAAVEVCGWLEAAGLGHAVLKGPALATLYPHNDREYVDLDILVSPRHVSEAIAILQSHGAENLEEVAWPPPDGITELAFRLPREVTLDLHANLVSQPGVRRDFNFSSDVLLNRATMVSLLGSEISVLDPEDTLLHVCVHAMVGGGYRLAWLADLDAVVAQGRLSWPAVVARARQARAALVVGVMLERAAMVLGTPIPPETLRQLRRRGVVWAFLLQTFERARPTATNFDRSVRGQVLVRATRDTTARSLVALSRLVWTDVVVSIVKDRNHPWRVRFRRRLGRS